MSFETFEKHMQSFQNAVARAISLCGSNIFENKRLFVNVIEDLVPYHESDYKFLKKTFDMDLGYMLKAAYESAGQKEQYFNDILNYLYEEVGLSEKKAFQFIDYFAFLKDKSNSSTYNKIDIVDHKMSESSDLADRENIVRKLSCISVHDIEKRIVDELKKGNISSVVKIFENNEQVLIPTESYSYLSFLIGEALEDSNPQNALLYLSKSATKGNDRAMFLLGYMYENGEGTIADLSKATYYYKLAADKGHRGAQHNLGCFYYFGNSVNRDYKNAYEYFFKAAQQGKAESMKNIGVMYELGQYVDQDYKKALEWYTKASENGDYEASEYYRILEKNLVTNSQTSRVLFRVLNKDSEKKDLYINIGEEIRGRRFSNYLSEEPILKLLFNKSTRQVGIKNMSDFDWNVVKANKISQVCQPNKVVPIEQGDMIKIINRVVQLNVISVICD